MSRTVAFESLALARSLVQPVMMEFATLVRVALVQGAELQTSTKYMSSGGTIELFAVMTSPVSCRPTMTETNILGMRAVTFKQVLRGEPVLTSESSVP